MLRPLLVLAFVALSGCDFAAQQTVNDNHPENLVNRSWRLEILFGDMGQPAAMQDGEDYSILFTQDGKISGRVSCNQYNGTYQAEEGGSLHIDDPISSSLALCRSGSNSAVFLEALRSVTRFDLDENTLALSFGNRGRLIFYEEAHRQAGLLFPTQFPTNSSMEALLFGRLEVQGECLSVTYSTDGAYTIPVWPNGFTAERRNDSYTVFNERHEPLLQTGDLVQMSGGFVSSLTGTGIDDNLRRKLEQRCPGQYWFVGEEVAAISAEDDSSVGR